jgi:hypothetical protein
LRAYSRSTFFLKAFGRAELVDDDGMVDDEIDGDERIDLLGIAAERLHRVAHRREVDDGGNAGEVLHQHAGRAEGDFLAGLALVVDPGGDGLDVGLGDGAAVLGAQQVLEQHLHREGQGRNAGEAVLLGLLQAVIDVGLGADLERLAGLEAVERHVAMIPSFWRPTSRPKTLGPEKTHETRRPIGGVIEGFQSARHMVRSAYRLSQVTLSSVRNAA